MMVTEILATRPRAPASWTRRFRSSAGAPLRSTLTMTAGPTFSYPTATFIQRSTSRIGERPGCSGRSFSEILTERNFRKCHRQQEADSPSCWREGEWRVGAPFKTAAENAQSNKMNGGVAGGAVVVKKNTKRYVFLFLEDARNAVPALGRK